MSMLEISQRLRLPYGALFIYVVLLVPATLLAFAESYSAGVTFSGLSLTFLIQVHALLMALWLLMLIMQVWFIRTRRLRLHRWLGRSSYIIAPAIISVGLIATNEMLNRKSALTIDDFRLEAFTWGQLLGFGLAWGLAILYRRNTAVHLRFMISTTFAIGSAIVFRIILSWFGWVPGLESLDAIAAANWTVLTIPLLILIALDWRAGLKNSPYYIVASVITIMHIGFFTFTKSEGWAAYVRWFAKPASCLMCSV